MAKPRQPIRMFDLEGNFLQDFDSVLEASEFTGCSQSIISECANGYCNYCGNFQFRKGAILESIPSIHTMLDGKCKPIAKYWKGRLISVYNSQIECAIKNKIEHSIISNAVNKEYAHNGFTFKFINA